MPSYVIHIGAPKVGSKYLQSSLAARADELREDGIHYPIKLLSSKPGVWHMSIYEYLRSGKSADLEQAFTELNASGHRFVVLSFEGFYALTDEQLVYLKELLSGSPVQIVYYCRRWSERIPSKWKQHVKEGFVTTFPEMYAKSVQQPVKAPDLNPKLVWDKFSGIFGRDSLNIVSLNNLVDNKIDLFQHFMKTFLDGYSVPTGATFRNESPDIFDTEILRALNGIHLGRTGKTSDKVRIRFLKERKNLDVEVLLRAMQKDVGELIVSDQFQVFDAIYQDMNAYLDRLVSPEYGKHFFKRKAIQCKYVQQNYVFDEAIVRALNKLYDAILQPAFADIG